MFFNNFDVQVLKKYFIFSNKNILYQISNTLKTKLTKKFDAAASTRILKIHFRKKFIATNNFYFFLQVCMRCKLSKHEKNNVIFKLII